MDQATLASWHDFYLTMGTASASLIGLLFVSLSLNVDLVTSSSRDDLRAFGEQAFSSFTIVLLIAVFFLIPEQGPTALAICYLALGTVGGYRILRRAPAIWKGRRHDRLGEEVFWRSVLPAAAMLGLIVVAVGILQSQPSSLYWLVPVIIGLLMSAARSSWDLLVKVGDARRSALDVPAVPAAPAVTSRSESAPPTDESVGAAQS